MDQAKEMAKIAFEALEDKKGENVCAIDISSVSVLADYFVIANGNSDSQVRALVENVEEKMHKACRKRLDHKSCEGRGSDKICNRSESTAGISGDQKAE